MLINKPGDVVGHCEVVVVRVMWGIAMVSQVLVALDGVQKITFERHTTA